MMKTSLSDFPDYIIYSNGEVFSKLTNKFLSFGKDKRGYCLVNLKHNIPNRKNKYLVQKVHRLVAKAFIPNPDNLPEVNHKDGNKLNNDVSNLEWVTTKQNIEHAIKNNLYVNQKKRKLNDLSNLLADFLSEKYSISELEDKYNWHTSRGITGNYLKEYAESVGLLDEYLKVKSNLPNKRLIKAAEVHRKPVLQYTENGEFIKEWPSLIAAEKGTGARSVNISNVCKGKAKTCSGFVWKFKNESN